jgi:cytochrome c-type biogenesis protein CcmH/NrfG
MPRVSDKPAQLRCVRSAARTVARKKEEVAPHARQMRCVVREQQQRHAAAARARQVRIHLRQRLRTRQLRASVRESAGVQMRIC